MGRGNTLRGGGGGKAGGGGGSRARNAPSIVHYRKQRGRNERFKGKKTERLVSRDQAAGAEGEQVTQLLIG